jgi:hypothetical protein
LNSFSWEPGTLRVYTAMPSEFRASVQGSSAIVDLASAHREHGRRAAQRLPQDLRDPIAAIVPRVEDPSLGHGEPDQRPARVAVRDFPPARRVLLS